MSRRIHDNVASVVEVLADRGRLTVGVVAAQTELPRASVQRIADGLVAADLAEVDQDGQLALTTRWLHLAETFRRTGRGWPGAHDVLQALATATGLTSHLFVPDRGRALCVALCVDRAGAPGTAALEPNPGGSLPGFAGAGRIVLAHSPESAPGTFEPLTPTGLATVAELRADAARVLADGHVLALEDVVVGVGFLAVPVLANEVFLGALSVAGPVGEVTPDRLDVLRAAAEAIARHYRS